METKVKEENCGYTKICEEINLVLAKFRITLYSWKAFDRSYMMDYGKNCYSIANIVVMNNVMKYWSNLKECQSFPFLEGLFHRLPLYKESYPLEVVPLNCPNKT